MLWTEVWTKRISTLPLFHQQPSNFTSLHLYTSLGAHTTYPKECNTYLGIKLEKPIWCSLGHSPLIISGTPDWKTTENNNYALELEQGAGPSVLIAWVLPTCPAQCKLWSAGTGASLQPGVSQTSLPDKVHRTATKTAAASVGWNSLFSHVIRQGRGHLKRDLNLTNLSVQMN